jgi:hypothetical protein
LRLARAHRPAKSLQSIHGSFGCCGLLCSLMAKVERRKSGENKCSRYHARSFATLRYRCCGDHSASRGATRGLVSSLIRVLWPVSTLGGKSMLINPFHGSRSNSCRIPRSSVAIQREIYRRFARVDATSRVGCLIVPSAGKVAPIITYW